MAENKGFTFLRWNNKYGEESNFVVRDNKTNKQAFFTPGNTKDLVWTTKDLTETPTAKGWTDFANETVDDLEDVVF
ncbi:hypothetical protein D3C81_1032710 [compost metagenome]